jgi:hypothetical protein
LPSGDTSGHNAPPVVCVSWRVCVPSIENSNRLNVCSSAATAAITARPSGRHAGVVNRVRGAAAKTRTALVATSTMTISGIASRR